MRPTRRPPPAANQPAEPALNLLDRAIAWVAPRTAARRLVAREQLSLMGGYSGARRDRASLAGWRTRVGSPETDVIADLDTLRQRCADLERSAPVGAAVINTNVLHVVGTGLACNPQLDAALLRLSPEQATAWEGDVKRRFRIWAASVDCHLSRHLNFYGLQDQVLRGTLSRGDIFTISPRVHRNGRDRLALQLIEADRVANPLGKPNDNVLTEGIEHDATTGEALRYHVLDHHPGDLRNAGRTGQWIDARGQATGRRNVLHSFRQTRPELRRGVPILAPVIEPIKQITRYTEAELEAAVVAGLFAVFLKMDPQAFQDLFDDPSQDAIVAHAKEWSGEIEGGKAINLLPGEEPIPSNPGRPNAQFDPFVQACMRQIGMALSIPYEVLVMHFQSSYSAAKGALLMAWRCWMGWRDWMATSWCQPVYELWLADEVAEGRVPAPGFFADPLLRAAWCGATWVGDGPGSLDPKKDVDAAEARINLRISTLEAESLALDGVDWETKHRQAVKETAASKAAGFVDGRLEQPPAPPADPPA